MQRNTKQQVIGLTVIGIVTLILSGCTGVMPGGNMAGMDHSMMTPTTPIADINTGALMTSTSMMSGTAMMSGTQMGGMDHSQMNMDPSKPFDAQFIDGMIEHHQGAIEMAQQALDQAEHEELRTLAEAIIAAQNTEIEQMQEWRTAWYADLPPTGGMDMGMGDMVISSDESIPFDQRFITAMISHHQGAIDMATMAKQMAEHQEIRDLADAIITAQQAEIEQMQAWEQAWFGGSQ